MFKAALNRQSIWKLPGLKQLHQSPIVRSLRDKELGHFRGRFKTSEEARLSASASRRSTWDDEALVQHGIASFSAIHLFDWPAIYFLDKFNRENTLRVVTDFGGHVGVKFYAYRGLLDFLDGLSWQVVEVPALIREGERRVPPDVRSLRFFDRVQDTAPCDVLICSGVLQYADTTIEEIVSLLPAKPRMILLNKVAVSERGGYFTVERYIKCLAYRVYGPTELEETRLRLGYSLAANWAIPHRDVIVLSSEGTDLVHMVGEAWELRN